MLSALSQCDQALVDTLIHRSDGWTFDLLAEMFGFPRPAGIEIAVWRHALRVAAYGHRGTLGTSWAAVELGLRTDADARTMAVTIAPGAPHRVTFVSGPTGVVEFAGGFTCKWVGRYVRLRYHLVDAEGNTNHISKVLYTTGPYLIPDGSPTGYIELAPTATGLWSTEDCSTLPAGTTAASLELLSFTWREPSPGPLGADLPAAGLPLLPSGDTAPKEWVSVPSSPVAERCLVQLEISDVLYTLPPTYLLDPGGVDRATFPNQPDGGIIMDLFGALNDLTGTLVEKGDPLGDGPSPLYLLEEATATVLSAHFDVLLAAGVDIEIDVRSFCLFEGFGVVGLSLEILFPTAGVLSDARLATNASAPGVVEIQTLWPFQSAYVFSGGDGVEKRRLKLVATVTDKRVEFSYANGNQPGTDWDNLAPPAAVATVTITDTDALQNRTIIITTTDGTTITATEAATTTLDNTNTPTFEAPTPSSGSKKTGAATNLAACLNANNRLTATSAAAVVTVTQAVGGAAGNGALAGTAEGAGANTTPFAGGFDQDLVLETSPTGSAPWTVVWTGPANVGPAWLVASVDIVGTKHVRWRQLHYAAPGSTKSDNWAIGLIRVWDS